jgi:O-antigen/teichoic acid export membrane protein
MPGERRLHPMASMGLARLGSLVPISIATLVLSRIVIEHYGVAVFNGFALVISTMALLPPTLTDLGVGTAVTTSYAERGPDHEESRRLVLTGVRALVGFTIAVVAVSLLLSAVDGWTALLGDGAKTGAMFGVAMAVYALGFVPGIGQSMLLGVNRSHLAVIVLTFHMPLTAAAVGLGILLDAPDWTVILLPAVAMTVVRLVMGVVTSRVVHIRWSEILAKVPSPRRHPGAAIRATAAPALIIALAVPAALQSDRLVLSHFSTESQLAEYAVSMQIFAPLLGVLAAIAQPLWPMFTRARAEGAEPPGLVQITTVFSACAAVLCAGLVVLADPVGRVIGGDDIELGIALPLANAAVVVATAATLPLAMAMRDAPALRFVATCCVIGLALNLPLSIVLADHLGAPGPLVASALVGVLVQILPAALYYRRHHGAGAPPSDPDEPDEPAPDVFELGLP